MAILVLGSTGMLGNMVLRKLSMNRSLSVTGTARKPSNGCIAFDIHSSSVSQLPLEKFDYVINCIGITKPYCHDNDMAEVANAINVNARFPHELACHAKEKGAKVIQIATDCVYSGRAGKYREEAAHDALDVYGKTKSLGEYRGAHFLNIRCSIIGPERNKKAFLLEWFLSQKKGAQVKGFTNHVWNGVTTLQFAELCEAIIVRDCFDSLAAVSSLHHFVPNDTVSKYELLCLFNSAFDKGVTVEASAASGEVVDRTLATGFDALSRIYPASTLKKELGRLNDFINTSSYYTA